MTARSAHALRRARALLVGAVAPVALALALTACDGSGPRDPCKSDAECGAGQVCQGGYCLGGSQLCSATSACEPGLSCCGGVCSAASCCQADFECANGYCDSGACKSGSRPSCSTTEACAEGAGRCLVTLGRCVECLYSSDCVGSGLVCSPQHACVPSGGCTATSCAGQGLVCAPEQGGCRPCLANAECGSQICNSTGQCVACTSPSQCGVGRTCVDGACAASPGRPCTNTDDCGDGLVCVLVGSDMLCQPCINSPECGAGYLCSAGRCVAQNADCTSDLQCSAPTTICKQGRCKAGCGATGCAATDICNEATGRCVPFSNGTGTLGAACTTHSECLSNVCWPIQTSSTQVQKLCSQACVRHDDCPSAFLCIELGDGNLCVPRTLLSATPGSNNVAPGGVCTDGFISGQCTTGYCNTTDDQCMQMCGRDADCSDLDASFVCVARWPYGTDQNGNAFLDPGEIGGFTELCQPPLINGLESGEVCFLPGDTFINHDRCQSGFCAQTPDFFSMPMCAQPCCSQTDCPQDSPVCKPIDVWDGLRDDLTQPYGFQKVCLWREYQGTKEVGETCAENSDCKSELCAQGASGQKRCTVTCCANEDCAALDSSWFSGSCRPPFFNSTNPNDDSVADLYFNQLIKALGREYIGFSARDQAIGITTMCMPK